MVGQTFTYKHIIKTEILEIDKEIPSSEMEDFLLWIKTISVEVGTGKHKEFFSYSEDYKLDVGVTFYVSSKTL